MGPNPFPWLRRVPGLYVSRVMTRALDEARPMEETGAVLFHACTRAELATWSADPALELDSANISAALARGDSCVGAFEGGRLLGYVWFGFDATPHTQDIWVRIPPGGRYAYKVFVRRNHRGKGIGRALFERAGTASPHDGRAFGMTYMYVDNLPSIRSAEKAGWRTLGFAGYLAKGRILAPFYSPRVARTGFRYFRPAVSTAASAASRRRALPG